MRLNIKQKSSLKKIYSLLSGIVRKIENKKTLEWIENSEFEKEIQEQAAKLIAEFKEIIFKFLIKQKRKYLKTINSIKYDDFKKKVNKAKKDNKYDDKWLLLFLMQYISANDNKYILDLENLYGSTAKNIIGRTVRNDGLSNEAINWINRKSEGFAVNVQNTTSVKIAAIVQNAIKDIETEDFEKAKNEIIHRINSSNIFYSGRAQIISRTEITSIINAGIFEELKRAGFTHKEWRCEKIPTSRNTHIEADRRTAPINEPFIVGGYELMFPGDTTLGAPPEEIVNCLCTIRGINQSSYENYIDNSK